MRAAARPARGREVLSIAVVSGVGSAGERDPPVGERRWRAGVTGAGGILGAGGGDGGRGGHGKSSKPSDGMNAKFPAYRYADMVELERRLVVEGLKVDHLRLVMGTSMGGMHTWLWGERWPEMMDALMPLASLPAEISGRNR